MKLIAGCLAFAGLACWSSINPAVDRALCVLLLGGLAVAAAGALVWWLAGEALLWWECVRPDPQPPAQKPVYAGQVDEGGNG